MRRKSSRKVPLKKRKRSNLTASLWFWISGFGLRPITATPNFRGVGNPKHETRNPVLHVANRFFNHVPGTNIKRRSLVECLRLNIQDAAGAIHGLPSRLLGDERERVAFVHKPQLAVL